MIVKSFFPRMNSNIRQISLIKLCKQNFSASFNCKSCSKKTQVPECTACHRMVNYFQIFNIPEQYKVDEKDISSKAKELQKQYHPDKHSFKQDMEQIFKDNLIKYSAYINEAKATLLDDLRRAIYMMELKGIDIQDSTLIQDNKFMMEMFTLQQQIEDADKDTCIQLKYRIETIMKSLRQQFDNFFKSQDMNKCQQFVFKYKYLHRALTNLNIKLNSVESNSQN